MMLISRNYSELYQNHSELKSINAAITNERNELSSNFAKMHEKFYTKSSLSYYIHRIESFKFKPLIVIFSMAELFFETTSFSIRLITSLLLNYGQI